MSGNGFSTGDKQMEVHLEAMFHSHNFMLSPDVVAAKKTNKVTFSAGKRMSKKFISKDKKL